MFPPVSSIHWYGYRLESVQLRHLFGAEIRKGEGDTSANSSLSSSTSSLLPGRRPPPFRRACHLPGGAADSPIFRLINQKWFLFSLAMQLLLQSARSMSYRCFPGFSFLFLFFLLFVFSRRRWFLLGMDFRGVLRDCELTHARALKHTQTQAWKHTYRNIKAHPA